MAAVPGIVACWLVPGLGLWSAGLLALASATDFLDGFLARRWRVESAFGAFLDPVADKLAVAASLVALCARPAAVGWASTSCPWLVPVSAVLILSREIAVSALREWTASVGGSERAKVKVSMAGKLKTTCQLVALVGLLWAGGLAEEAARRAPRVGAAAVATGTAAAAAAVAPFAGALASVSAWCLLVADILTIVSMAGYFQAARPTLGF